MTLLKKMPCLAFMSNSVSISESRVEWVMRTPDISELSIVACRDETRKGILYFRFFGCLLFYLCPMFGPAMIGQRSIVLTVYEFENLNVFAAPFLKLKGRTPAN